MGAVIPRQARRLIEVVRSIEIERWQGSAQGSHIFLQSE